MELLGIWLVTIAASLFGNVYIVTKIVKDIADAGYKIKPQQQKANKSNITTEGISNINKLSLLIPIYNFSQTINLCIEYSRRKSELVTALDVIGALEPMTPEECRQYQKSPHSWTCLYIMAKGLLDQDLTRKRNNSVSETKNETVEEDYEDVEEECTDSSNEEQYTNNSDELEATDNKEHQSQSRSNIKRLQELKELILKYRQTEGNSKSKQKKLSREK